MFANLDMTARSKSSTLHANFAVQSRRTGRPATVKSFDLDPNDTMRIINAARFSGLAFLAAFLFTVFSLRLGLRTATVQLPRQVWLQENEALWMAGGWLWLLAVFSWMVLLVALIWSYLPGHRIATMLQSGLMIISAVLTIAGVITWMNVLPYAANQPTAVELIPFVDTLALTFFGAGLFMGGAVTAWLAVDLARLNALPGAWVAPAIGAGLCFVPAPFILPWPYLVLVGLVLWLGWCLFLGTRREMPSAYSEWL